MKLPLIFAIDLIAVLIFAIVGRGSHAEAVELVGVSLTAWPFLLGTAAGTILALIWHRFRPSHSAARPSAGVLVWVCTVTLGVGLRLASGGTAEPAFVVVATISLGVLLLGWRVAYRLIRRARQAPAG